MASGTRDKFGITPDKCKRMYEQRLTQEVKTTLEVFHVYGKYKKVQR